jgi:hypothetical protein
VIESISLFVMGAARPHKQQKHTQKRTSTMLLHHEPFSSYETKNRSQKTRFFLHFVASDRRINSLIVVGQVKAKTIPRGRKKTIDGKRATLI